MEFVNQISPHRQFAIKPYKYDSLSSALDAIKNHEVMAALYIPKNYSEFLDQRIEEGFMAENETIEESTLHLYLDNTVYMYGVEYGNIILESFVNFSKKVFNDKNLTSVMSPFDIEMTPMSKNLLFKDYYLPGYFMYFLYSSQVVVASLTLTQERKDGLYERSLISGVSHELVFFSHVISSALISMVQILLVNLTGFVLFDNNQNGSFWFSFAFLLLQSFNAMSIGFVISALIDAEIACIILVWFITIPQILSSGLFWPIESVGLPYTYLFYLWPLTIPVKVIRRIMLRDWGLDHEFVQYGVLTSALPMFFFFCVALLIFKRK